MDHLLATYRLQLHAGFRIADAEALVPYLSRLGITHLYLSPLLRARRGSTHGYDVVDPTALNPELGPETDLERLAQTLRRHRMGLLLDIVPNHMATGSENPFWENVLTHGRCAEFAEWFDIDWGPPSAPRPYRIFLPVLGDRLARVLDRGELRVGFSDNGFRIHYFEHDFPIDPATASLILDSSAISAAHDDGGSQGDSDELEALISEMRSLPARSTPGRTAGRERRRRSDEIHSQLHSLYTRSHLVHHRIDSVLSTLNARNDEGTRRLRRLLAAQPYRLAYWRRAAREVNYRRFFTISHLVGVRAEVPAVFAATHALVLDWVHKGWVNGLRVDHIDGLLDPTGYLQRLGHAVRDALENSVGTRTPERDFPIFVEKILARDETLSNRWPIAGTTGYDFLVEVDDLLLDSTGFRAVETAYRRFSGKRARYDEVAYRCRREVLTGPLVAEARRLSRLLLRLLEPIAVEQQPSEEQLREALIETAVALPVYRTFFDVERRAFSESDRNRLEGALAGAAERARVDSLALELVRAALSMDDGHHFNDAPLAQLEFIQRFQQLCVPVAAKGIEDTAFYRYLPLVSRNEVGGAPDAPLEGAISAFHEANQRRAQSTPLTLLAVSTHDTKRSADVRARLAVLSELPAVWRARLRRWHRWNRRHRTRIGTRFFPDANTEYLLYQTLVGIWPLPRSEADRSPPGAEVSDELRGRVEAYMQKAAREAKLRTSWVDPNAPFEEALGHFVRRLLSPEASPRFLADLRLFVRRIARPGIWNSLARTLLQLTSPGTPDLYQGDELWNLSLVDPDNRRPVDFRLRRQLLEDVTARFAASGERRRKLLEELLQTPEDGRIKLHLVQRALFARRENPALFQAGAYLPLAPEGSAANHVVAFARSDAGKAAITIAPRRTLSLSREPTHPPIGPQIWVDTRVGLPGSLPAGVWRCCISGREVVPRPGPTGPELLLADALSAFPLALLLN